MIDRKKHLANSISKYCQYMEPESTFNLKSIAQELEEIKDLVTQIESNKHLSVNKAELERIEYRLNILEFELYYGSLN